jgi:L-asparaginase II
VLAILAGSGLTEDDLGCPPALPMHEPSRDAVIAAGGMPARRFMNCSGKHAGMLAACVAAGWDTTSYREPDHPLQRAIGSRITDLAGERPGWLAVDGCGAPLYMLSLVGLARAFGRVAAAPPHTSEGRVAAAMRANPFMVAGTGRDDTRLMEGIPGLLAKGGAEGVHCAALPDGTAVAIKIDDGAERARMPVLATLLRGIGLTGEVLDDLATGVVLGGGRPVGTVEVVPGALDV